MGQKRVKMAKGQKRAKKNGAKQGENGHRTKGAQKRVKMAKESSENGLKRAPKR